MIFARGRRFIQPRPVTLYGEPMLLYIQSYSIPHIYQRAAPKLMRPLLLCWPTTSEADVGDIAVEIEPSRQYSVNFFFCRATVDSREASVQNGV
jgi:hypothetical protein